MYVFSLGRRVPLTIHPLRGRLRLVTGQVRIVQGRDTSSKGSHRPGTYDPRKNVRGRFIRGRVVIASKPLQLKIAKGTNQAVYLWNQAREETNVLLRNAGIVLIVRKENPDKGESLYNYCTYVLQYGWLVVNGTSLGDCQLFSSHLDFLSSFILFTAYPHPPLPFPSLLSIPCSRIHRSLTGGYGSLRHRDVLPARQPI